MEFVKKIIIIAIILAIGYGLMGYHYVIYGSSVKMLKKSELSLKYTIFNAKGKEPEKILRIEELHDDGIGEVLVEFGLLSQERLEMIEGQIREEQYNYD